MKTNEQGLFNYIRDAPEHTLKANVEALPALNMAASVLSRYNVFSTHSLAKCYPSAVSLLRPQGSLQQSVPACFPGLLPLSHLDS